MEREKGERREMGGRMRTQTVQLKELYFSLCQHGIVFSWKPSHSPMQWDRGVADVTAGTEALLLRTISGK
jgi:hypothetical protein